MYHALKEGAESVFDHVKIPADRKIVTVCAGGKVSLTAAELLQRRGIKAYSLQGGMKAWNFAWNIAELQLHNPDVHIIQVRRAVDVMKAEQLYESLQTILSLPKTTIILPAHISRPVAFDNTLIQSTLSDLKSELELLQLSKSEFIKATLERIPEPPENYLTIAGLNKKGSYKGINAPDLETGANRCAVS